jgi:hypothetical protein
MIFFHHDLRIDLPDAWWREAEMGTFRPAASCYPVAVPESDARRLYEIAILDIAPVRRNPGVAIFNDNEELPARDRVLQILRGFRARERIPPIELVDLPRGGPHRFKLTAGVHRLYARSLLDLRSSRQLRDLISQPRISNCSDYFARGAVTECRDGNPDFGIQGARKCPLIALRSSRRAEF